jgi:trk system potassium uptake protein TrkA
VRVLVIGGGEVGQNVARVLSGERHDVTLIDQDTARVEALQGEIDALVLAGNGASPRFLRDVSAGQADLLVAVTQRDETNVIAALAGHQLGANQTIARVRDPDYFGPGDSFARDELGIDFLINPERATAEDLAEAILLPGAVHVEYFAAGRVAVAESILTERSGLLGLSLAERRRVRPHSIIGIIRDGQAVPGEPGHRPRVGDHVLVAAAREDIRPVVANLAGHAERVHEAVVFGGGRIGLHLARRLHERDEVAVTVMERDRERARYIAERLPGTTVLHEEGIGREVLLAQGVDRAGAFVACAGDDRANLLAALHAKKLGAGICMAVVSREEFIPLVDALGIDTAVSPRLVTSEAILRAVRGENVRGMYLLLGGAEVLEVQADPGCRAEGRTIEQTDSMARTHIAAIVRDGRVILPDKGRETVRGSDRLVVFNTRRGVADVERTFTAP